MSPERNQGGCIAVRSFTHSSSFSKCNPSQSSLSGDAHCGTPVWRGKGLTCVCFKPKGSHARICINLTSQQEQRLNRLKHRTKIQFDASRQDHQEALRALWSATYPGQELQSLVSDQWKEMGWQGKDPSTDFRFQFLSRNIYSFYGSFNTSYIPSSIVLMMFYDNQRSRFHFFGEPTVFCQDIFGNFVEMDGTRIILALLLLWPRRKFNKNHHISMHQISFQSLLRKQAGKRAVWEYPFAVAGVNVTFMIMQMLDLDATKPRTFIRAVFLQMLSENEWAFDLLYCVAFMIMDKLWLDRNASYMEFNDILKLTRCQLEKEFLMDDVLRIEDMPSFTLLT